MDDNGPDYMERTVTIRTDSPLVPEVGMIETFVLTFAMNLDTIGLDYEIEFDGETLTRGCDAVRSLRPDTYWEEASSQFGWQLEKTLTLPAKSLFLG